MFYKFCWCLLSLPVKWAQVYTEIFISLLQFWHSCLNVRFYFVLEDGRSLLGPVLSLQLLYYGICVYMYVCGCVCMCVCVCMCECICVSACVHVCVCVHAIFGCEVQSIADNYITNFLFSIPTIFGYLYTFYWKLVCFFERWHSIHHENAMNYDN